MPLTPYEEAAGAVAAQVYLREPDAALADKYLSATAQYIEMYRGLIGALSVRQVRTGGKFLGDRLRHAVVHLAGTAGHSLPVHPDLFLSP